MAVIRSARFFYWGFHFLLILLVCGLPGGRMLAADHAAPVNGKVIYVDADATGPGGGSSWALAFSELTSAINQATAGDQIWVAEGVYYPGWTITHSFQIPDGVQIYGGFDGTETQLDQRQVNTHVTVLSGDIGGDDLTDAHGVVNDPADIVGGNALHVVDTSGVGSGTVLDGFTITAGKANSGGTGNYGAGIYNINGSPTLRHLVVTGNKAYNDGGGMYNFDNSNGNLENVIFRKNEAGNNGGGLYNLQSEPTLERVTFSENYSGYLGGGLYNYLGDISFTNGVFKGNEALEEGGGMYNDLADPNLTNLAFSGNRAKRGGGLALLSSNANLVNLTLAGNDASNEGGGLLIIESNPTIANTILWDNRDSSGVGTPNASFVSYTSNESFTYSLVQGVNLGGVGCLDGRQAGHHPLFRIGVDPSSAPTSSGDLGLQLGSPAIEAGKNSVNSSAADPVGTARVVDGDFDGQAVIDLGAYEYPAGAAYAFCPLAFGTP